MKIGSILVATSAALVLAACGQSKDTTSESDIGTVGDRDYMNIKSETSMLEIMTKIEKIEEICFDTIFSSDCFILQQNSKKSKGILVATGNTDKNDICTFSTETLNKSTNLTHSQKYPEYAFPRRISHSSP